MLKELVVCRLTPKADFYSIIRNLKERYGKYFLGMSENSGLLLFFSKDILESEDYFSLVNSLSGLGKISKIGLEEVDLEAILKDVKRFSYVIRSKLTK